MVHVRILGHLKDATGKPPTQCNKYAKPAVIKVGQIVMLTAHAKTGSVPELEPNFGDLVVSCNTSVVTNLRFVNKRSCT